MARLSRYGYLGTYLSYWDQCHEPRWQLGLSVFNSKFTQYEGCFRLPEEACSEIVMGEPIDDGFGPWGLVTQTKVINSPNSDDKKCVGKTVAFNNPTVRAQIMNWFPQSSKGQFRIRKTRMKEEVPMVGLIRNSGSAQNSPRVDQFLTEDFNSPILFFLMIAVILVLAFLTFCVVTVVLKRRTPLRDFPGQEKTRSLEFHGWKEAVA